MDDDKSFSLMAVGVPCWFAEWDEARGDRFDEKRVGLDHIAFEVKAMEELQELEQRLKNMNVQT